MAEAGRGADFGTIDGTAALQLAHLDFQTLRHLWLYNNDM